MNYRDFKELQEQESNNLWHGLSKEDRDSVLASIVEEQGGHAEHPDFYESVLDEAYFDPVRKPSHYNQKGIECIQAIEASMTAIEFQGYLKGNTLKYLWRFRYKDKMVQDLEKGQWYHNLLIEKVKEELNDV
jgi:hypothetical protein